MKYFLFSLTFIFTIPIKLTRPSPTITNSYIVKLNGLHSNLDHHLQAVEALFINQTIGNINNKILSKFTGLGSIYHATFTKKIVDLVKLMREVEFIEPDSVVKICTIQKFATWGLTRISRRPKVGSINNYRYNDTGAGVTTYIIDTGIMLNHPEFEGRAQFGARFIGENDEDEHGHGTHCAGTVGSKTYGVAKKVNLVAVKVLDSSGIGTVSSVISGINWAVKDKRGSKGNVINLSLGGDISEALNDAVQAAVLNNFVVVVAAGNENQDACMKSPASALRAITVAAMNFYDIRSSFSNWGLCVDIFAPGENVLSTWNDGGTKTISGTSMATPHISGLAAYFLSQKPSSVKKITAKLISLSTKDKITQPGIDTPNRVGYNGYE